MTTPDDHETSPVELTPTARTILGFLLLQPRSGYEIREATKRSVSLFWGMSDGQLYPSLRRLEADGYVHAPAGQGAPRARTEWHLTQKGRDAIDSWLAAPTPPVQIRDESLVKILFAAQAEPEVALRLINERRASFVRLRDHIEQVTPGAEWSPERRAAGPQTPEFIRTYGLSFAETVIAWCDEVTLKLGGKA